MTDVVDDVYCVHCGNGDCCARTLDRELEKAVARWQARSSGASLVPSLAEVTPVPDEPVGKVSYLTFDEDDNWADKIDSMLVLLMQNLPEANAKKMEALRTSRYTHGCEATALIDIADAIRYIMRWRVSKRLTYVTDFWGCRDVTHFELKWNGKTLQVDVDGDKIKLVGPCFKVTDACANAATLTLTQP